MAPSEPLPPASTAKGPPSGFGKGFVMDTWYFVALSRDVAPGSLKRHEVMGEPVLIGRTRASDGAAGTVFALRDICPHRAAPLSAGRIVDRPGEGQTVECPYHGWRFGTDGRCAAIPSLVEDQPGTTGRIRVRSWPVVESQGMVFVFMRSDPRDDTPPDHAPPVFPGIVGGEAKLVEAMDFDSHIDHAVVGLMDPAHGPYVHQQWWWRSEHSMHEKAKAFAPSELGFTMVRHAPSSNSRAYRILGGTPETEITFRLPGYRWEHIQVGPRQVLALTCLTPVTETRTRITQIFWSDHWVFGLARPFLRQGVRAFLKQDGGMVNLQNEGLRYDPSLIWIDDADRQARWYQQLKREWGRSRAEQRPFVNPIEPVTLRWNS
ncbi:aromatic ring-hydroxylating oxygenase subunit alpha [Brevundimonas variabilis]|uniref:Phenylpropionate dioxygenase-like ring-hydroxylating dioxygenase large terminal subunit n=1 Tax=Brevundimonas variabilis TaxID=74312 RepID=A0A7W9FEZ4_9CAUL|nr:aromatic ring-hydroxylating dioxygenase subunit alpha [Brevundimonas variabilis]MBB5744884.1 phenylpropionate dioxygenase-like ring-hydroxylating dioxygenase large terminal subunit [Brevundimonas variabilis]